MKSTSTKNHKLVRAICERALDLYKVDQEGEELSETEKAIQSAFDTYGYDNRLALVIEAVTGFKPKQATNGLKLFNLYLVNNQPLMVIYQNNNYSYAINDKGQYVGTVNNGAKRASLQEAGLFCNQLKNIDDHTFLTTVGTSLGALLAPSLLREFGMI